MTAVYDETAQAATGTDPRILRCDTPGHGDVTGDWLTASQQGWDLPGVNPRGQIIPSLHPAGLRLCPQCVDKIVIATKNAVARAGGECAQTCSPDPDISAAGQLIAVPRARWAAAAPPPEDLPLPGDLYGKYGDTAAIHRLYEACDAIFTFPPGDGETAPPEVAPEPEPVPAAIAGPVAAPPLEPLAEAADPYPVSAEEDEHITGVLEHLRPEGEFWAEADARDGHTTSLPAVGGDAA